MTVVPLTLAVIAEYLYDGGGARAKKTIQGGSVTYYIGAHFEVKDGVATNYIFGGNMRVASITPTATYDYHKDHLESERIGSHLK
ncbi:MAG: hypothetical protein SV375_19210 [Thermodesulfobacteriota bacterium]|nr:hypothetical protein [Thermodesulfobacteriota bacterium]